MAFTSEQIAALEAAIARGVLTVKQGDEQVTYRSLDEMRDILRLMKREAGSDTRSISVFYPTAGRGL